MVLTSWLYGGIAAIVLVAGGLFYWHYRHLESEAAKVPLLEEQIVGLNSGISAATNRIRWNELQQAKIGGRVVSGDAIASTVVRNLLRSLNAIPTPVECLPSPGERQLFNDAVRRVVTAGRADESGSLPASGSGPGE